LHKPSPSFPAFIIPLALMLCRAFFGGGAGRVCSRMRPAGVLAGPSLMSEYRAAQFAAQNLAAKR
jgi:hypothetical protein